MRTEIKRPGPWTVAALALAIRRCGSIDDSCAELGIDVENVRSWMEGDSTIDKQIVAALDGYRSDRARIVADGIMAGGSIIGSCALAGISFSSLGEWMRQNDSIKKTIIEARAAVSGERA